MIVFNECMLIVLALQFGVKLWHKIKQFIWRTQKKNCQKALNLHVLYSTQTKIHHIWESPCLSYGLSKISKAQGGGASVSYGHILCLFLPAGVVSLTHSPFLICLHKMYQFVKSFAVFLVSLFCFYSLLGYHHYAKKQTIFIDFLNICFVRMETCPKKKMKQTIQKTERVSQLRYKFYVGPHEAPNPWLKKWILGFSLKTKKSI